MYMPGRLRTASRPSRTVIELPVYSFFFGLARYSRWRWQSRSDPFASA